MMEFNDGKYSNSDIKKMLLKHYEKYDDKEYLELCIDNILDEKKKDNMNCSREYYYLFIDKGIKKELNKQLEKPKKHSAHHYTNAL